MRFKTPEERAQFRHEVQRNREALATMLGVGRAKPRVRPAQSDARELQLTSPRPCAKGEIDV